MNIPDISSDEILVKIIDEIKYRLKPGYYWRSKMRHDFNNVLDQFISKWNLGTDPHNFAVLPKNYKELFDGGDDYA